MPNEVEFEYTGRWENVPKDVTIVRCRSSVKEVGREMFQDCKQLKKVVLNEGLKKIGFRSFYYCYQLEHINFPSTLIEVDVSALCGCHNLKDVVLNEGLQTIGETAFCSCRSLKSITFPSTLTKIGNHTFYDCQNLREVVLNGTLKTIGRASFESCTLLERITIPLTVTDIGRRAFYDCQSLREVELHEGIQMIGSEAFKNCSSLETFKFPNPSTRLDTIIQDGKYVDVENKIDEIRSIVERRGSEMFISDKRLVQGRNWDIMKGILGRIDQIFTYYEVKEATTLLELAMWKSKIDQAHTNPINRDIYRIDIPGPVKNTILQYLNFRV